MRDSAAGFPTAASSSLGIGQVASRSFSARGASRTDVEFQGNMGQEFHVQTIGYTGVNSVTGEDVNDIIVLTLIRKSLVKLDQAKDVLLSSLTRRRRSPWQERQCLSPECIEAKYSSQRRQRRIMHLPRRIDF